MIKKIRVMTATYKNIHLPVSEAKSVRGFFADLDYGDSCLHNHREDGQEIYRYPLVQYKVVGGHPVVVAIEEGIRSIHPHLMEQTQMTLGGRTYTDMALNIRLSELPLGDSRETREYQFAAPWLALNQKNFEKYKRAGREDREAILSNILIGNILSMCKGLGVTIENRVTVAHQLEWIPVWYKGKRMEGFKGSFQVNCCIPDLCGIGKGTARGFGTVKYKQIKGEMTDGMQRSRICRVDYQYKQVLR